MRLSFGALFFEWWLPCDTWVLFTHHSYRLLRHRSRCCRALSWSCRPCFLIRSSCSVPHMHQWTYLLGLRPASYGDDMADDISPADPALSLTWPPSTQCHCYSNSTSFRIWVIGVLLNQFMLSLLYKADVLTSYKENLLGYPYSRSNYIDWTHINSLKIRGF